MDHTGQYIHVDNNSKANTISYVDNVSSHAIPFDTAIIGINQHSLSIYIVIGTGREYNRLGCTSF